MVEHPWRIDLEPVRRAGWSRGAPSPAPAGVDLAVTATDRAQTVPVGRGRPWDAILASIVLVALVATVLKPWGGATPARNAATRDTAAVQAARATPVFARPMGLPDVVFAPPARTCMQDIGWSVCVLGRAAAAEQSIQNTFAPGLVSFSGEARLATADPVAVLTTVSGATIAFYAPRGFYSAEAVPTVVPTRMPDATDPAPTVASGPVTLSAWHVEADLGPRMLALVTVGTLTRGGNIAANVFVPVADALSGLPAWPTGRYVVWLQGGGLHSWEQFFDFSIANHPATPGSSNTLLRRWPPDATRPR